MENVIKMSSVSIASLMEYNNITAVCAGLAKTSSGIIQENYATRITYPLFPKNWKDCKRSLDNSDKWTRVHSKFYVMELKRQDNAMSYESNKGIIIQTEYIRRKEFKKLVYPDDAKLCEKYLAFAIKEIVEHMSIYPRFDSNSFKFDDYGNNEKLLEAVKKEGETRLNAGEWTYGYSKYYVAEWNKQRNEEAYKFYEFNGILCLEQKGRIDKLVYPDDAQLCNKYIAFATKLILDSQLHLKFSDFSNNEKLLEAIKIASEVRLKTGEWTYGYSKYCVAELRKHNNEDFFENDGIICLNQKGTNRLVYPYDAKLCGQYIAFITKLIVEGNIHFKLGYINEEILLESVKIASEARLKTNEWTYGYSIYYISELNKQKNETFCESSGIIYLSQSQSKKLVYPDDTKLCEKYLKYTSKLIIDNAIKFKLKLNEYSNNEKLLEAVKKEGEARLEKGEWTYGYSLYYITELNKQGKEEFDESDGIIILKRGGHNYKLVYPNEFHLRKEYIAFATKKILKDGIRLSFVCQVPEPLEDITRERIKIEIETMVSINAKQRDEAISHTELAIPQITEAEARVIIIEEALTEFYEIKNKAIEERLMIRLNYEKHQ